MDNNTPDNNKNKMQKGSQTLLIWVIAALITLSVISLMNRAIAGNSTHEFTYSEFIDLVKKNQVESVSFGSSKITITPKEEI